MKSFIDKIKGTYISAQELFDTFKALQLMSAEDLISFWQTIQFTIDTAENLLSNEDKKKICYIEKIIVDNMVNLSKKEPSAKDRFYQIVLMRDKKRDPIGLAKLFGGSDYENQLSEKLK
ncbi:MAG: hypothetical protein KBB75_02515 [Candidatus Pacebacteria bacterium]|jgi:hypothetical protein|nr:hypothetical protein [Candidatus Paceibacterota bacterium]